MPNIEVHGFESPKGGYLAKKIFEAIVAGAPELKNEAVVTIYNDCCINYYKTQPFLRICSTNPIHTNILVRILKPLGYDIETMVLTAYYPKDVLPEDV